MSRSWQQPDPKVALNEKFKKDEPLKDLNDDVSSGSLRVTKTALPNFADRDLEFANTTVIDRGAIAQL